MTSQPVLHRLPDQPSTEEPQPLWRRVRAGAATTPGRLWLLLSLITLTAVIAGATAVATVLELRETAVTVAKRASPAVVDAARVRAVLADADRVAVQNLLPPKATGGPGELFQDDIRTASQALVRAADNNAADEAEGAKIQGVNGRLVVYLSHVSQAHGYGTANPGEGGNGRRPEADLDAAYLSYAADLMYGDMHGDIGILASVDEFRSANQRKLPAEGSVPWFRLGAHLAAGLVLLGLLAGTQVFIRRRFHRRLSLGLIIAAVVLALVSGWTVTQTFMITNPAIKKSVRDTAEITCMWQKQTLDAVEKRDKEYDMHMLREFGDARAGRRASGDGGCATATSADAKNLDTVLADSLRREDAVQTEAPGRVVQFWMAFGALGVIACAAWTCQRRAREYRSGP